MKTPILETERLILRPLNYRDVDALFLLFSNPNVMKYDSGSVMVDKREAKKYVEMSMRNTESGIVWGFEEKGTGALIGTGGIKYGCEGSSAEVGLLIDERYWNQKYGSEAVKKIVEFAFQTLQFTYVFATTLPKNHRSIRLLQRLGFRFYGWTNYYLYANRYVKGFVFVKSKYET